MANGTPPVVLVDDNDDILQVTRKGLELHGFEVHAFNDPVEALKHVEGCKDCQVLVSDIRMPKMNGFQLVRKVKLTRPEMKVILMSAFEVDMPEFQTVFPKLPVDDIVRKPFAPSRLAEKVKENFNGGAKSRPSCVAVPTCRQPHLIELLESIC
jgi:DNA-binding NtrC family response regulator